MVQSRAEQSRAEQSRAEQSRAEQSRAEQSRAEQYNAIDVVKFFMAICVVAIHTHPLENLNDIFVLGIYSKVIHEAVPFFFVVSGYLLFCRIPKPYVGTEVLLDRIKHYGCNLGRLYLVWTVIYLPLAVYDYYFLQYRGTFYCIASYVRGLFFTGEHYYSWPLWYLLASIYAAVFLYVLFYKNIGVKNIWCMSMIVLLIGIGMDWLILNRDHFVGGLHLLEKMVQYTFGKGRIFTGIVYISTGMLIANYRDGLVKIGHGAWFTMLLFVSILYFHSDNPIFKLLNTALLVWNVLLVKLPDNVVYKYFRLSSLVIYLTHMLFFFVWTVSLDGNSPFGCYGFAFALACSALLSLVVVVMSKGNKNAYVKKLFN